MWLAILAATTCLSTQDVRDAQCNTGCKWAGYEYGFYRDDKCHCVEEREFERTTQEKRTVLSSKRKFQYTD